MANWLERARREISSGADRATAKTAERNPTAVMAVPDPGEAEISGGSICSDGSARAADLQETETVVPRPWLAHIKETDDAIIAHLLDQFRVNMEARDYFLLRAAKTPPPDIFDDDRRRCDQCANLTERGLCLAARRGDMPPLAAVQALSSCLEWRAAV